MNSYDFLKHLTVYLEGSECENAAPGFNISATGFYAIVCIGDKQVPVVITAKHFAEKICLTRFTLHSISDGEILTLPLIMRANWILSDDCDLAYCKLSDIEENFKKIYGKKLFYTKISKENLITENERKTLSVLSEIISVGYSLGLYSTHNRYPLFFKGHLSTAPKDNLENTVGYADISANHGQSGSPILLNNSVPKLVGIMSGAVCKGENPIVTGCTYVDAHKILEFKNEFSISIQ